jgi:hypothetical protein
VNHKRRVTPNSSSPALPAWTRLAHRVRRFLSRQQDLGLWYDANGRPVCGYVLWREQQTPPAPAALLRTLREEPKRLRYPSYEAKRVEQMAAEDWRRLFDTMFRYLAGPASLDDVVSLLAVCFALAPPPVADHSAYAREAGAPLKVRLTWFWRMLVGFGHEWRAALLLNMPGDLASVIALGGATAPEAGRLLALTIEEYDRAAQLLREEAGLELPETPDTAALRFGALLPHLPLRDDMIAKVLQVQPFQVLNLRLMVLAKMNALWESAVADQDALPPLPGEHL